MMNYCSKFAVAGVASLGLVAGTSQAATIPPVLVDDFQAYDLGDLPGQGAWNTAGGADSGDTQVAIAPGDAGNKVLSTNEFEDIFYNNDATFANFLPEGGSATVYLQFRTDAPADMSLGFAQNSSPGTGFGEFAVQAGVIGTILDEDEGESRTTFRVRDGGSFSNVAELELREWYELWFDIDNDAQQWSISIRGGEFGDFGDEDVTPTTLGSGLGYRNTDVGPLQSMLIHGRGSDSYIDNIHIPEPASLALLGVGGLMLLRRRR